MHGFSRPKYFDQDLTMSDHSLFIYELNLLLVQLNQLNQGKIKVI